MFQESLVESTPLLRTRNRWPALFSIGVQVLLAALFVAIPLVCPEALSFSASRMTSLSPPMLRRVPPPPPPARMVTTSRSALETPASTQIRQLPTPSIRTDATPMADPPLAVGVPGLGSPNPLGDFTTGSDHAGPRISVAEPGGSAGPHSTLKISSGVIAGLLMTPIRPVYPPIARLTRTEGVVIVQATISRTGMIESAHIVSGPAVLQSAALAAVRDARYRPYLLNSDPTEVETTITINFRMGP